MPNNCDGCQQNKSVCDKQFSWPEYQYGKIKCYTCGHLDICHIRLT